MAQNENLDPDQTTEAFEQPDRVKVIDMIEDRFTRGKARDPAFDGYSGIDAYRPDVTGDCKPWSTNKKVAAIGAVVMPLVLAGGALLINPNPNHAPLTRDLSSTLVHGQQPTPTSAPFTFGMPPTPAATQPPKAERVLVATSTTVAPSRTTTPKRIIPVIQSTSAGAPKSPFPAPVTTPPSTLSNTGTLLPRPRPVGEITTAPKPPDTGNTANPPSIPVGNGPTNTTTHPGPVNVNP